MGSSFRRGGGCRGSAAAEQPVHAGLVAGREGRLAVEAAGPLGGLLLQDVVHVDLAAAQPAGAGDLEPLRGTAVRLHLGHGCFLVSWWRRTARGAVQPSLAWSAGAGCGAGAG